MFVGLLGEATRRARWIVYAYTLMPNHFHLLIELTQETLSSGMKWLNGCYARAINRKHDRVGHLFQGRFKSHLIQKDTYSREVARYIVLNAVRASIAGTPSDYEWSSYRATSGLSSPPEWLATDVVLSWFGTDPGVARVRYEAFVAAGVGSDRSPWNDLKQQIYLGDEDFVESMRDRVESRLRSSEHPRVQRVLSRPPDMQVVISAVASVMQVPDERIRSGHGGLPRNIAAWLGRYEGFRTNVEIAAALRLCSDSRVTRIIAECDRELQRNRGLQQCVDRCIATIGRKKCEVQT